jgi:glycine oxidase
VTIFDAGVCGGEASWAAAGMLSPFGEFDILSPQAGMAARSLSQYPAFIEELQNESGLSIDYRRCGALDLASAPKRFFPEEATVNPREVTRALSIACRRRGVKVCENQPMSKIPQVEENVLVAAGAWSSSLLPTLPRITPVRGHLVGYHLQPGLLETILRSGDTYLLQRSSGLLIAGSTTEDAGFDRAVDPAIVLDIHRRACRLLPALEAAQPEESWVGFRPQIEGDTPFIGQIPGTRVWAAIGHYRNGILLAPETARQIVESLL